MRRFLLMASMLLLLTGAFSACSDGGGGEDVLDDTTWPRVLKPQEGDISLVPLNSQIEVGDQRFAIGLLTEENELSLNASLTFLFFTIEDEEGTLATEQPGTPVSLTESFVTMNEDGTLETRVGPEVGGYVAAVPFDRGGDWGVIVRGTLEDGSPVDLRLRFSVLDDSSIPRIGDPAPRSAQTVLRDVRDIVEIDSSNPPHPEMHEKTIAEALDTGKPVVIAFATPAFCTSRICGPVVDEVIVPLLEKYGGQVEFVHVEPYDLDTARSGGGLVGVPALLEWGIRTEPWVFVVDAQGKVASKFEGIMTEFEVDAAIQQVLG